jgi:hypothetical protein
VKVKAAAFLIEAIVHGDQVRLVILAERQGHVLLAPDDLGHLLRIVNGHFLAA